MFSHQSPCLCPQAVKWSIKLRQQAPYTWNRVNPILADWPDVKINELYPRFGICENWAASNSVMLLSLRDHLIKLLHSTHGKTEKWVTIEDYFVLFFVFYQYLQYGNLFWLCAQVLLLAELGDHGVLGIDLRTPALKDSLYTFSSWAFSSLIEDSQEGFFWHSLAMVSHSCVFTNLLQKGILIFYSTKGRIRNKIGWSGNSKRLTDTALISTNSILIP